MPLHIVRNDISRMACDAIVNATDELFSGSGSGDAAIHAAAGAELRAACDALGGCAPGEAKITDGFGLPCRYVIHTVGPVWMGGVEYEAETLYSCYINALHLAREKECESIAFPIISAGSYGYPKDMALKVALDAISSFLLKNDMTVYLVVYNKEIFQISGKLFRDIESFIDDNSTDEREARTEARPKRRSFPVFGRRVEPKADMLLEAEADAMPAPVSMYAALSMDQPLDESFQQMLMRKITESGMTDPECYKRANIDRKLFAKIRKDPMYKPSKATAVAFAVALRLPMSETTELLMKAGYALTRSSRFDVIIMYFIENRNYNIYEINEALFYYDQSLLGSA